jgi:thioredoxin 1
MFQLAATDVDRPPCWRSMGLLASSDFDFSERPMTSLVTDDSFETDVLKSELPVVVDFWADWCPPCHAIAPSLEELSTELAGQVRIAKLNVDENPRTAIAYGVRTIPTLIVFRDGGPWAMQIGALPKSRLSDWIKRMI